MQSGFSSEWPLRVDWHCHLPVDTSQTLMVLSSLPLTIALPSGLHAIAVTLRLRRDESVHEATQGARDCVVTEPHRRLVHPTDDASQSRTSGPPCADPATDTGHLTVKMPLRTNSLSDAMKIEKCLCKVKLFY